MIEYNQTLPTESDKRQKLLKEVFAEVGADCTVETPLNSNWGCRHVHLGRGIYINSNVTFVDDEHIFIGDNCLIALMWYSQPQVIRYCRYSEKIIMYIIFLFVSAEMYGSVRVRK